MGVGDEAVYVAMGANLGDREAAFVAAIAALRAESDLELVSASPVYETPPVGPPGQGAYLNAVVEMRSGLEPLVLLRRLQAIESALGRDRSQAAVRWGPRVIDLDLLFFGDRSIDVADLTVPHPRAHERAFVMVPLADLAPDFRHPVLDREIAAIAAGCGEAGDVRRVPRLSGWPAD